MGEVTKKVEFGVYLPSAATGRATIARATQAEELGFQAVWVPDLIDPGLFECMTLTAAVAMATSRIRVGHGVINLMLRSPMLLARTLATLDHLSEGRLNIGLGLGVPFQFDEYGLEAPPYRDRVRLLGEILEMLKLHFDQDRFAYAGEFVQMHDVDPRPLPLQRPSPPIFIGGGSKRMLTLAARHADMWDIGKWQSYRVHDAEPKTGIIVRKRAELDGICREVGRDPGEITTVSDFWFTMAETREAAEVAADRVQGWSSMYLLHGGTPDDIQRALEPYTEAGVGHIILSFLNFARGETPKLFQREVASAF